ncbi:MAG: hypothetical protein AAGA99_14300 [Actinomycetota bacterium]
MGDDGLGRWSPMNVDGAVGIFRSASFRWWLSGGRALAMHLERTWRDHEDLDIGVVRTDLPAVAELLGGWDLHVAAAGVLTPWDGRLLVAGRSENNLWCRPTPSSSWALDVTVGDGTEEEWVFRRDPAIRRSWADAVLVTSAGIPYLAPELQLLFKSKQPRPKDEGDARVVIPALASDRRRWLAERLPRDHHWHRLIVTSPDGL